MSFRRAWSGWFLFVAVFVAGLADAQTTPKPRKNHSIGIMPSVTPDQFVDRGIHMVRDWSAEAEKLVDNRAALYGAVGELILSYDAFTDQVSKIYPTDQIEWILISDEVADTFAARVSPILEEYQVHHPDEVLTVGRQMIELRVGDIMGAPPRMLGFHVVSLSRFVHAQADTFLVSEKTNSDPDGIYDGVLRNIRDWCNLYNQVHSTERSIYESRIKQEDWIFARLKDNCGGNRWKIKNQYMALVGVDSTRTPPQDIFAHEFHLEAAECEGDSRVIRVELPNFQAMQMELLEERRKEAEVK